MVESSWDKYDRELKELIKHIRDHHSKWNDYPLSEEIYLGDGEYLCNYHLNLRKKKFKKGTIIIVVSPKFCPLCDVATLGIYSES